MIASTSFIPTVGDTYFQDASLMYLTPLVVCRSGVQFDIVSGTPSGRQVVYTSYNGRLTFDSSIPFEVEDLFIKYKI